MSSLQTTRSLSLQALLQLRSHNPPWYTHFLEFPSNIACFLEVIARALGEERTREELIPFLSENNDNDDDDEATSLAAKLQNLNWHWPNLLKRGRKLTSTEWNEKSWKYEWSQHGKCYDQPDNPVHYVNTTINIARKFKPEKILEDVGIVPDDRHGYEASSIVDAIQKEVGADIHTLPFLVWFGLACIVCVFQFLLAVLHQ